MIVSPGLWSSLVNIMVVNVLLSGDNAVVIALAAHGLPQKQQRPAILFGSAAAIVMRTVLTIFALKLLDLPFLKLVGGVLLVAIAIKLMAHQHGGANVASRSTVAGAVKTILLADLVMSLDNVLGVAAAAKGNIALLIVGLVLSVPLIVFGSTLVLQIMKKFPLLLVLGAALLGYLGGEMLISDSAIQGWVQTYLPSHQVAVGLSDFHVSLPGVVGAIAAVVLGAWRTKTRRKAP